VTKHIWRTIGGGVFFGVLPLLIGWKFDIAGVSLNGPTAAAIGVSVALIARFSIRRSVPD
jgi:hypothetical protein